MTLRPQEEVDRAISTLQTALKLTNTADCKTSSDVVDRARNFGAMSALLWAKNKDGDDCQDFDKYIDMIEETLTKFGHHREQQSISFKSESQNLKSN